MFTAQVSHYENLTALHKLISIVLQLANQIKQKFPAKSCGARAKFLKLLWGRGWNKDDYFVLFLLFIFLLALFQCFVIPPVLYRSAPLFHSAVFPSFRGCSVVPVVFRYSGVVPSFRGCSVFRCSWLYSMP